jgi:branched-chain amino acid transport system substrate-binding protein
VLIAALLLVGSGCSRRGNPETLWLGHIAPMTGPDKSAGDHARQGLSTAVEGLNNSGELLLERKLMVREAEANRPEAEAVRLASVNRVVALLGGTNASQAEQLARGAESAPIPVVLQSAIPGAYEFAFSVSPSLNRHGEVLGKFTANELRVGHVAVLMDERRSAASRVADAFAAAVPKESVSRWRFIDEGDLPSAVRMAAGTKPKAVLFLGSVHDLARLRAELEKALPGVAVIFGGDAGGIPVLLADRANGEDVYVVTSYYAGDETAANQSFVKAYQEQHHEQPDVNAALAYDGTRLLAEAIRKAASILPVKIRDALVETDGFESVTGLVSFGKDRHAIRPLFVVQIKNGEAVLKKRYGPEE